MSSRRKRESLDESCDQCGKLFDVEPVFALERCVQGVGEYFGVGLRTGSERVDDEFHEREPRLCMV
ncbi:hypothetical protein ACWGRV_00505 [Streptomyces sp. NPDC055663]